MKVPLLLISLIFITNLHAQIPILYYDFENNTDRTQFENAVELNINTGNGTLTKSGGSGLELILQGENGAGIYNGGLASGMAITTQQGGWNFSTTNPGTGVDCFYQFVVNTSQFSGISISFDNRADNTGPARTGVIWSVDGVNFFAANTPPVLTGNNTFVNSDQFSLPSGADNRNTLTIRIYAYAGSFTDRVDRGVFTSAGKFSIDNLTICASSISANAGSVTLLNEYGLYNCLTSGLTGSIQSRNGWTINSGSTAVLSSDVSLKSGQTLSVLAGGGISLGTKSVFESAPASFILSSGASINIGSVSGLSLAAASGNIQTTTRIFDAGASYIYDGSSSQVTGDALPASVAALTINNSTGVSLSANTSVTNTLTLTSGIFSVGSKSLTIFNAIQGTRTNLLTSALSNLTVAGTGNGIVIPSTVSQLHNLTISNTQAAGVLFQGNVNINNGTAKITGYAKLISSSLTATGTSSLTGSPTGKISLTGDINSQITGFTTNTFSSDGGLLSFAGSSTQTIPSGIYSNLQIANSGGANLAGDVTVTGTLTLNDVLNIGSQTLNITNPIGGISTNLRSTINSNLIISGSSSGIAIPSSITQLNNLSISNSQIVSLNGDMIVRNTLTLEATSAFLNTGSNTLTIGTDAVNAGELIRNGGSIRGTIKRWFASGVSTDKLFPLDNGSGSFSQAKITFKSLATGGTLTASFHNSGSGSLPFQGDGNYIPAPELGVNFVNLSPQYWTISAGDGLTGANYDLDLTADAIPGVVNITYIAIVKRSDNSNPWTWSNQNYSVTTGSNLNPVLHYKNGTGFSDFGIAGNIENLLPVELTSFVSSVNLNSVILNWSTTAEQNNSGFDIERKTLAEDWKKIGNVIGHGTVNTHSNYSYTDKNLLTGKYNYRLKQIDFNGNFKYYELSSPAEIGVPVKYELSQNYPNPFNPLTKINFSLPGQSFVSLKIFDMNGREVAQIVNEVKQAGYYTENFNAVNLSSGVYFYKIIAGDFNSVKKMVLIK